jgi:hypothetical protein
MDGKDYTRLANNFYISRQMESNAARINIDADLANYIVAREKELEKKYKVALVCICLNENYWPFAKEMMEGAKRFFLPGHQTDFFFWSDMPESFGATVFPTEPVPWPYPTLLRYNLFLQQEDKIKDYDYIFYCDIDMKFVNIVGDEILGEGITAAQHPMYALDKKFWPPYEPNEFSASYIKRPGRVIEDNGQPRFMPLYFAGGFQGGKAKEFIEAMRECKKLIEKDMNVNYIPIWNDETAWNKYLFENPPAVILTPSYIYPDSLIKEYYEPIWGCSYQPKLVTITKKFTLSKEGGDATQQMIKQLKELQK